MRVQNFQMCRFVKRRARARAREAACAVCRSRRRDYYSPSPQSPTSCIPPSPLLSFSCSLAAAMSPRSSSSPPSLSLLLLLLRLLACGREKFTLVMLIYALYTYTRMSIQILCTELGKYKKYYHTVMQTGRQANGQ